MAFTAYILLALAAFLALTDAESELTPAEKAQYKRVALAHGIMAALSWVIFFPTGAVLLRLFKGHTAVYIHGLWQAFSYAVFTSAVGMGIWMALDSDQLVGFHPVIGLIIFGVVSFQAVGGVIAHLKYKKQQKRTIEGRGHRYNGLFLITLGMINGGLGLLYSGGAISRSEAIAYGVVTAMIWVSFMGFVLVVAQKRRKNLGTVGEKRTSEATETTA